MLIELLQEKDIPAAVSLDEEVVLEKTDFRPSASLSYRNFAEILAQGFMLGAFQNDDLVGMVSAEISDAVMGNYIIADLAVKQSFRRRGVGRLLLDTALQVIDADNTSNGSTFLAVEYRDKQIIQLYEEFGFAIVASDKPHITMMRETSNASLTFT